MQKITMFVYNNFTHDARVLKEASTLINNDYEIDVLAVLDDKTKPSEDIHGIKVFRVKKDPFHMRFLKWLREFKFNSEKNMNENSKSNSNKTNLKSKIKAYYNKKISSIKIEGTRGYVIKNIKNNPIKFIFSLDILYSFIFIIYLTVKKALNLIKRITYRVLKKILLMFHKPLCFLDYYFRSYKITKNNPSDIYHAHDLNTLPVAYYCAKKHKAKLVYDSHEFYTDRNTRNSSAIGKFMLRLVERFYIKRCDIVITVNESLAYEYVKLYKIDRPKVIMNAPSKKNVPTVKEGKSIRENLNISSKYKLLLYTGSITFNRGLEKLIESMKYLPDCYLVFMGYGSEEYKKELSEKAKKHDVQSRFSYFGPVPSNEVTTYASSADLGIAPIENVCLSYYLCSPNKIFEYVNANLPIISSNFPEMKRVVEEYEIGLTFDPSDPLDISRAVKEIFTDDKRRLKMKENTLRASTAFNWENESEKLIQMYSSFK